MEKNIENEENKLTEKKNNKPCCHIDANMHKILKIILVVFIVFMLFFAGVGVGVKISNKHGSRYSNYGQAYKRCNFRPENIRRLNMGGREIKTNKFDSRFRAQPSFNGNNPIQKLNPNQTDEPDQATTTVFNVPI